MKLINLTARTLRLYESEGNTVLAELPTTPPAIEALVDCEVVQSLDGFPIVQHQFRLTDTLPPPVDDTVYVVGWAAVQALAELGVYRSDIVAPDTSRGSAVRDVRGNIIGVRRFRVAQAPNHQTKGDSR
jgi:hypothetical protein